MDNLTHTLVGAALGQAGLKRRTGLAMPALMIGANLPDIDVLGLPFGENLAWRRGWTHGPLALVLLPALLAAILMLYDRWQARKGTRPATRNPVRLGPLLLLSYLATLTHPLLDLMNNYGVRLLMPFSDRWFYGDVLFIVDPWIILALAAGLWLARGGKTRPAAAALTAVTLYTGAMALGGRAAETAVAREIASLGLGEPRQIMAGPVPINPFRRAVIIRMDDGYWFGDFTWLTTPHLTRDQAFVPAHMDDPAVAAAARKTKAAADFLYWSRFPFAAINRSAAGVSVTLGDARFATGPTRGSFTVTTTLSGDEAGLTSESRAAIEPVFQAFREVDAELAALPPPQTDAERLIRAGRIDAAGRTAYAKIDFARFPSDQRSAAFETVYAEIDRRDLQNQAVVKALLPDEGWFLPSKYGKEAADAAWLVAQHAIRKQPEFLRTTLLAMEKLLHTGEVDRVQYAMADDRMAMNDGNFQKYGSQMVCHDRHWVPYPIADRERVDQRRTEIGFDTTLAENLSRFTSRECPAEWAGKLPPGARLAP